MTNSKRHSERHDEAAPDTAFSLEGTVGTFESRLQKQLKEQEAREDESQRLAEERHARMLQALTIIRKALQETAKIKLGKRFSLAMDVNDWEGWPRLELNLVDSLAPERVDYGLVVTANDRKQQGRVLIHDRQSQLLARVSMKDSEEIKRLSRVLKKSVRYFLDEVGSYVLNPRQPEEMLEVATKPIDTREDEPADNELAQEDVFTDEHNFGDDNRVEEASTSPLEPLSANFSKA